MDCNLSPPLFMKQIRLTLCKISFSSVWLKMSPRSLVNYLKNSLCRGYLPLGKSILTNFNFLPVEKRKFYKPYALQNPWCNRARACLSWSHVTIIVVGSLMKRIIKKSHPACSWQKLNILKLVFV